MSTDAWFEVGRLRLEGDDFVRIEVIDHEVRIVRDGHWSLTLDRLQALRLSDMFETAVTWWPPRRAFDNDS